MDKELGFDEKWEKCELSVQAYNHSFKSPEMKKRESKNGWEFFFFLFTRIAMVFFGGIRKIWTQDLNCWIVAANHYSFCGYNHNYVYYRGKSKSERSITYSMVKK